MRYSDQSDKVKEMINKIQEKEKIERENIKNVCDKKNKFVYALTEEELLECKVIYSNKEIDFVIKEFYYHKEEGLLMNCLYLLNEYKMLNQDSKCNAIYTILNKYFTIENCYDDYSYYYDDPDWNGFKIVEFIECPTQLKEMIKEKVVKIKAEKQKKMRIDYKQKADKQDKKIIDELEL